MSVEQHTVKNYSIFEIASNLAIACLISGIIIAAVFYVTNPVAEKNKEVLKEKSMRNLVSQAETFVPVEGQHEWYKAMKDNKVIAYVVTEEGKGFGGVIKIMTAVFPDGKILNYDIISHNETPGLGDKANEDGFRKRIVGKKSENLVVVKDKSEGKVDAMTGATITSRAVVNILKKAADEVVAYQGGGGAK